ncbi:MAG: amino acid permease, partial [Planctomycetota bacterium]
MPERNGQTQPRGNRFGTFGGVFTPSILTILGVIMFMRANFVVGHGGIRNAVLILLIAKSITLLTALSASAIGTNMRVRGGGAYYLISRVLGPEFGGAIGIALFCALALSVPFYILGFTEALVRSVPVLEPHFSLLTFAGAAVLFFVAYVGAGWAIKTQYVIMTFLFLAIVAFTGGQIANFSAERFAANWGPADAARMPSGTVVLSFWALFAIYFPAVTGIDAGINMSGDLGDPTRSIPRGALAAVGVGFMVYLSQMLLGGGAYERYAADGPNMIEQPYQLLRDFALFGQVGAIAVVLGVFAATLSSALGSYLGGPRVLQAVSRDRILP